MKDWIDRNQEKVFAWIAVLYITGLVVWVTLQPEQHWNYDDEEESSETKLHNVQLSVASLMADPDTPVRDLSSDPRIVSYVDCGSPLIVPDHNADDDEMEAASYTRNGNVLVIPHPNSDVHPLPEYMMKSEFEDWYCVHNDGTVVGFTDEKPHRNINDL